jgi:phospholipid/cholesterol/gamma-HCH transport system substrate-binding protein
MGSSRNIEILVGTFFVLGVLALFALAMNVSNLTSLATDKGYEVTARFENIGGLRIRAKVTLSGVNIGRVARITYDKKTFRATVIMKINSEYDYLPEDTQASVYTAGLLGEQYIALEPGASDAVLTEGSIIELTQSAIVLEEIIGKVLVSFTSKN